MWSCKICCLFACKSVIFLGLLLLVMFVSDSGQQVASIVDNINYYQSNPNDFTCQNACGGELFNEYGGSCCNTRKTYCEDKTTCLQNQIDYYEGILDQPKKMLIIYCCSTAVAIPLAIFLLKKIKKCQQNHVNQRLNEFVANIRRNDQFWDIARRRNHPVAAPPLLAESFIAQERDAVCVVCYMEFEESRVVRLDCGHMYHRLCIQQWRKMSGKCPICGRTQP